MAAPLTRDQVLDELEFLATVEHALIVEYLTVCCALGHDLDADQGGPTTDEGREAAGVAFSLAVHEMSHLRTISFALIAAGREARLDRAFSISSGSGPDISLDPPGKAELERLVEREVAIATALDDRYFRLAPAVTSDPVFEDPLLDQMRRVIAEDGPKHASALANLKKLGAPVADGILRATRRETTDPFEQRLLDTSDKVYRVIVGALQEQFVPDSFTSQSLAVSAMEALDEVNRALIQRGLLPPFSAP
jgi:hypothetical protein